MQISYNFFIFTLVILVSCVKQSEQVIKVPNVMTEYETIIYPDADSTFPVNYTDKATLKLSGEIPGQFKILFGPLQTNPNDPPITETLEFKDLVTTAEFETDWYGDPMRIKYVPSAEVSQGSLTILVTFYALE